MHDGHEPVLAAAVADHRAGVAAEAVFAVIHGHAVEGVLQVAAHEKTASAAEPVVRGDAGAGIDLARNRPHPLMNRLGPARVLPVVGVNQADVLDQLAIAAGELGCVGEGPARGGVVIIRHQRGEPHLHGQRRNAGLLLEVVRLQSEVLRVRCDQFEQPPHDFLFLRGRGKRGDVVVQRGLQRLHPASRAGVRGIGEKRSQVARMRRDQRGDFAQVGTAALAQRQPHGPALLAADHQVNRPVAVEVGEVHNRTVGQGVQIQLRKGGAGDAERAVPPADADVTLEPALMRKWMVPQL